MNVNCLRSYQFSGLSGSMFSHIPPFPAFLTHRRFLLGQADKKFSGFQRFYLNLVIKKKKKKNWCWSLNWCCCCRLESQTKIVIIDSWQTEPWSIPSLTTVMPLSISVLWPFQLFSTWQPGVQQTANVGLLHPSNMVTASRNNNQLDAGFMNKWSIPRRPYFPRFSLFSWAHCWPWKEVI